MLRKMTLHQFNKNEPEHKTSPLKFGYPKPNPQHYSGRQPAALELEHLNKRKANIVLAFPDRHRHNAHCLRGGFQ